MIQTYQSLLKRVGVPQQSRPELFVDNKALAKAQDTLEKKGVVSSDFLIGINPFAAYGLAKCWPIERYRSLLEKLDKETNIKTVVFGDTSHMGQAEKLCDGLRAINLAGKTSLSDLKAFISLCHLFVTNDSGPMHIASALNIPVLAIFGSTCPTTTGPYGDYIEVVQKKTSCSPCFKRECPIDFRCMKNIGIEEIYQRVINYKDVVL